MEGKTELKQKEDPLDELIWSELTKKEQAILERTDTLFFRIDETDRKIQRLTEKVQNVIEIAVRIDKVWKELKSKQESLSYRLEKVEEGLNESRKH